MLKSGMWDMEKKPDFSIGVVKIWTSSDVKLMLSHLPCFRPTQVYLVLPFLRVQ